MFFNHLKILDVDYNVKEIYKIFYLCIIW